MRSLISPFLLATPLFCQTITESLVFTYQPNSATTLTASFNLGSTSNSSLSQTYSGTINANLTFDQETLTPSSITFNGGRTFISRPNLTLRTLDIPNGAQFEVIFASSNISSILLTTNPPGQIIPPIGLLNNSQHLRITNTGTLTTTRNVRSLPPVSTLFDTLSETTNFATNPLSSLLTGQNSIALEQISSNDLVRNLRATATISIDEEESNSFGGGAPQLIYTLAETGTITAFANFTIPTAYGQWALDNGLTSPAPTDTNEANIPFGLLFAFDLSASATSLPIEAISTEEGPKVEITLPTNGLAATLVPLYSPDLETEFTPLEESLFEDGPNSLDEDQSGPRTLSFPASDKGFIQIAIEL